jgi:ribosome-associated protein
MMRCLLPHARYSMTYARAGPGVHRAFSANEDRARIYLNRHGLGQGPKPVDGSLPEGQKTMEAIRGSDFPRLLNDSRRALPQVGGRVPTPADIVTLLRDEGGALDIVDVDVSAKASFTNALIICTGRSAAHVAALSDRLIRDLRAREVTVNGGIVGRGDSSSSDWTVVDAGLVVTHILLHETRRLYDLESLWKAESPPYSEMSADFGA